jgi:hypothetical protein
LDSSLLSANDLKYINLWIGKIEQFNIKNKEKKSVLLKKANNTLQLKYQMIGAGKHRVVYDLNNGFVLKVVISLRGIQCNSTEVQFYTQSPDDIKKYLCPVKEYGHGWIIMQKVDKIPKTKKIDKMLTQIENKFKEMGIKPMDLRRKNGEPRTKNLALSAEGDLIIIDYGNFKM